MAYVYDNKTYRNLQQQVKENMENIAELQEMKLVGIDVAGIVADSASLPSSAQQGQIYAVGSASPYELYVYNNSSWVDFGQFPKAGPQGEQGPQGEPGRQGPRGLTGPQGPRGYTGATGAQGPQGPSGADGPQGPRGPQGLKGPKGDKGDTGDQGSQGPQGIQGPKGDKGDAGPQGPQGVKGDIGPQGPKGDTGPQGPEGPVGPQGPIGPQGPKGDQGEVPPDVATKTYVSEQLATKQDKLNSYSDSASVANDKLTINYKVKQEDGTYSNVPVEFQGGAPVDEKTIITNADGTISTALGGYIEKVERPEQKWETLAWYKNSSGNWVCDMDPSEAASLCEKLKNTKSGDYKKFIFNTNIGDLYIQTQSPASYSWPNYNSSWTSLNRLSDDSSIASVKLEINASTGRCALNDAVSAVSSINKMSYTIESHIEKIIHNANEEIAVGVNNDQIITGKKIFANAGIANQRGAIYIGTKSDSKGAFILSSESDPSGVIASLTSSGSIEFSGGGSSDKGCVQLSYRSVSGKNRGHFSPRYGSNICPNDLGTENNRWVTLYCDNLSDGTTTKTMTDVLSGTTEEWTFTLSDGTTTTKTIVIGNSSN